MVLEQLAQGILNLVDWVRYVILFLIILEVVKAFHKSGGTSAAGKGLSNIGQKIKDFLPGSASRARNTQKKEINEWISENEEEKNLDKLKGEALHILTEFEAVANRGELTLGDRDTFLEMIDDFGKLLLDTKRTFRQLNRNTSRANTGLDDMLAYFKKKGIAVPDEVKALENNILKLHQETAQEIAKVEEVFRQIINSSAMTTFKNMTDKDFGGKTYAVQTGSTPFNLGQLHLLIRKFQDERFLLEDAYKKQAEAKKEMTGIIQETRDLYK